MCQTSEQLISLSKLSCLTASSDVTLGQPASLFTVFSLTLKPLTPRPSQSTNKKTTPTHTLLYIPLRWQSHASSYSHNTLRVISSSPGMLSVIIVCFNMHANNVHVCASVEIQI